MSPWLGDRPHSLTTRTQSAIGCLRYSLFVDLLAAMKILVHSDLDPSRVRTQYEKIVGMLERDDFYSADVKKLARDGYYRAKLDDATGCCCASPATGERYALLLEIIEQHAYRNRASCAAPKSTSRSCSRCNPPGRQRPIPRRWPTSIRRIPVSICWTRPSASMRPRRRSTGCRRR